MALAEVEAPPERPRPGREPALGAARRRAQLPYFPALDGLRGLAVAAVLAFHGGFSWMVGGFLGVSTFFTLSGFLITSLLLAERGGRGALDLRAFWARRFRRLMPAALACLAFVILFGVFAADPTQRRNLAGDELSALAYVANWRFILADSSYADLFAAPSPVLHFWSIAIEEQFYLVLPVLLGGLFTLGAMAKTSEDPKRRYWLMRIRHYYRGLTAGIIGALAVVSFCLVRFGGFSVDRIYFGTDTRASELLVGGLLAVVLFHAPVTARLARPGAVRSAAAGFGVLALIAVAVLWVRTPQTSSWLYEGGFTLYAAISALVVLAAILPAGPVPKLLAIAPIRHLGRISYGVYLYHWPVFLWVRQETTLGLWPRFALSVAITLVMAELSFRYLETPIREGRGLLDVRPIRLVPYVVPAIVVAVLAVSLTAPKSTLNFGTVPFDYDTAAARDEGNPGTTTPPPPSVAFFGDSTAITTGWGVGAYLQGTGAGSNVEGYAGLGCSVIRTDERRIEGVVDRSKPNCLDWEHLWGEKITRGRPDVAVVQIGPWDIADRKVPGADGWRSPGDPRFDEFALSEMVHAVDVLSAQGALVVWLTSPLPGRAATIDDKPGWDASARMTALNAIIERLPDRRPGKVEVVDLAGWFRSLSADEDARLRPDGIHLTMETSREAADSFIAGAIIDAWRGWWEARQEGGAQQPPSITQPPTPVAPVSVVVVGDGTAEQIAGGLSGWAEANGGIRVRYSGAPTCGIGRQGTRRDPVTNAEEALPADCTNWEERFPLVLAGTPADVVVAHTGLWDVVDRSLDPGVWRTVNDDTYDLYLLGELLAASDRLHVNGARVVWLLTPHVDPGRAADGTPGARPASEPERIDRLNDLLREVAAKRDFVTVLDYAAQARSWPGGEFDPRMRADGVGLTAEGVRSIADWLAPQLIDLVRPAGTGAR
ncbi:acyltransferase family protein [Rhabdothermincola sp.]|uniref:acyltransferase family protein n=1 Tax=Rhabdothermincola sp. TaxID=2820405 RepID=UPI002FE1765C